jgi:lipopolysaccharide biosynthesis glycosyltransferase
VVDTWDGGVWAKFFGVPIPVSAAPAFFSAKGKAPIVVAWSRALKDGRYRCEIVATYQPEDARDIRGMTQRCISDLERVIRRHPSAWVLNYNFFRNVQQEKNADENGRDTPISISLAISDSYSQHLAVTLVSVLENNPDERFIFHVLHSNVSLINQELIGRIALKYPNCDIRFHSVDAAVFNDALLPSSHISVETYFRLLLPKVLKEERKTLYMDVDVLARCGIRKLWNKYLDGFACAAVNERTYPKGSLLKCALAPELSNGDYFNAGVVLFNLEYIRENGLDEASFDILCKWHDKIGYADQDVLNLAYHGKVNFISQRYNFTGKWLAGERRSPVVIRHYASFSQKPWNCKLMRFTWIPYVKYLRLSPYRSKAAGFVLRHMRSLLYWRYNKNGYPSLDICGVKVWKGRKVSSSMY